MKAFTSPLILCLAFCFAIATGCKKHDDAPLSALARYTKKMAGVHIWHGTEETNFGFPKDTVFNITNDTISIFVVNDSSIALIWNFLSNGSPTSDSTFMKLQSFIDSTHTLVFENYYWTISETIDHKLSFDYINNTMVYRYFSGNHGGSANIILYTP